MKALDVVVVCTTILVRESREFSSLRWGLLKKSTPKSSHKKESENSNIVVPVAYQTGFFSCPQLTITFTMKTFALFAVAVASLSIGSASADCPLADGDYTANTSLSAKGRLAVEGCVEKDGKLVDNSGAKCDKAVCKGVTAKVAENAAGNCAITINQCFSQASGPTSLAFEYACEETVRAPLDRSCPMLDGFLPSIMLSCISFVALRAIPCIIQQSLRKFECDLQNFGELTISGTVPATGTIKWTVSSGGGTVGSVSLTPK